MDVSKAKPATVQPAQALKRTEESQRRETQAKEQPPKKAEAPKRPVVNAQGHTTGRLLNVSA